MKRLFLYMLMTCTATVSGKAGREDAETSRFDYVHRHVPAKHTFDLTRAQAQLNLDNNDLIVFGFSPVAGQPHKYTINHAQLVELVKEVDREADSELKGFIEREKEKFRAKYGVDLITAKVGRSTVKVPPITKNYLFNPKDYNDDESLLPSSKLNLDAVRILLARKELAPDQDGDYKISFHTLRELTKSKNKFLTREDYKYYRICEELESAFKQKYHTFADYIGTTPKKPIPSVLEFDASALPMNLKLLDQSWFQKNGAKYKIHYSDLLQLIKKFNDSQMNSNTKGLRDAFAQAYGVNLFSLAGIKNPLSEKITPPPSKPAQKPIPKPVSHKPVSNTVIHYAPSIHTFGQTEFEKLKTADQTQVKSILNHFGVKAGKNGQYRFSHRELLAAFKEAMGNPQSAPYVPYLKRMLTQVYGYDVLSAPLQPASNIVKRKPSSKPVKGKVAPARRDAASVKKRGATSKTIKGKSAPAKRSAVLVKKRSATSKTIKGKAALAKRSSVLVKKRSEVSKTVKGKIKHNRRNVTLTKKKNVVIAKKRNTTSKLIKGKYPIKRQNSASRLRASNVGKKRKIR